MMDLYLTSLALGGVGLGAMALSGFLHRSPGHGSHAHAGHAHHGAHHHAGHVHAAHSHAGHGHAAPAHAAHSAASHSQGHGVAGARGVGESLLALMSPRVLFSVCLGLGTTGIVLRPVMGGALLLTAAVLGGILFERVLVTPIWNFAFRFESAPALTLEHSTGSEATAVTSFDADGQGLIAVDVDGQLVQLLGTLRAADRAYGMRVAAGTLLRIEDVDPARNRCTVSLL